ncbi:Phosphate transporter [Gracilaria domingensis]|nr:Phosphate transporter [Gracilaria domingensis]
MAESFTWPLSGTEFKLIDGVVIESVDRYRWIVIVGGILAFAMAWGIGANDVANAFATSVGAGSLDLKWACVIAAVMEFAGAVLLGGSVTDTVRKKIIKADVFNPLEEDGVANGPELLMTGFLVALITATTWLIVATYFSLPVSTTHSIIGSLVGVGLAFRGGSAVVWISSGSGFGKLKGLVGVILSWIISPVLSAILAIVMFLIVRTLVLRRKEPLKAGYLFMPLFYGITISVTIFFIIFKGDKRFGIKKKLSLGAAIGIAFGAGALVALISFFTIVPLAKKYVERWDARQKELAENPEAAAAEAEKKAKVEGALKKVGINLNVEEELGDDVIRMHDNVEKFDPKTERLFTWVQVFTAAFDAFAHGANDVANAIAPFASIYQLYRNNGVISKVNSNEFEQDGKFVGGGDLNGTEFAEEDKIPDFEAFCGEDGDDKYIACQASFPFLEGAPSSAGSKTFSKYDEDGKYITDDVCYTECNPGSATAYKNDKQEVPIWILALGGAGIVLGLAMWGYRIIVAIGVKLTKLTPSRGFAIEIGAAITVLIASSVGIPVSTTHCQVGATMGVGLVEFKASTVNWKQFFFICVGWVFTVVLTGAMAAAIYAVLIYTPMAFTRGDGPINYCPGNNLFQFNSDKQAFQGIACSGLV